MLKILNFAEQTLDLKDDLPVEVEYGENGSSNYVILEIQEIPSGLLFVLKGKKTDCLAPDKCGVKKCCGNSCC